MKQPANISLRYIILMLLAIQTYCLSATAQPLAEPQDTIYPNQNDLLDSTDDGLTTYNDLNNLLQEAQVNQLDSLGKKSKRDWNTWRPNAKRAMWLAIVIPGAGQVYNRKYWKLPIVYGGFMGCIYAMRWNNMMFHDYSQAYIDIMDNDPNTHSYDQFLHLGNTIDDSNISRYQELFRQRKDRFRRWRDLSFFALIGVYALSVVDAYVDASLSEFDLSDDLSLRVEPTLINSKEFMSSKNQLKQNAIGLQCSLNF